MGPVVARIAHSISRPDAMNCFSQIRVLSMAGWFQLVFGRVYPLLIYTVVREFGVSLPITTEMCHALLKSDSSSSVEHLSLIHI